MDISSLLDVAKSVLAFGQAEGSPLPKVLMLLGVVLFTAGLALQQSGSASSKSAPSAAPPVQTQQTTTSPTITVSPTFNVTNGAPQTQHTQPTHHEPKTQESKPANTAAPPAVTPTPAPAIHQETNGSGNNIIQGPNGRVEINNYGLPSPPPTSVLRLQTVPLEKPPMPIGPEPVKQGPNDYMWRNNYMNWNRQMADVRAFRPGIAVFFKVPRNFVRPAFRIRCDVACVMHSFSISFDMGFAREFPCTDTEPKLVWIVRPEVAELTPTQVMKVVLRVPVDSSLPSVEIVPLSSAD